MSHLERGGFEGRLTDEESVHDTAEGPHVGREAVTLLVQHLGGDVVRGPTNGPATQGDAKPSGTLLLYGTMWVKAYIPGDLKTTGTYLLTLGFKTLLKLKNMCFRDFNYSSDTGTL